MGRQALQADWFIRVVFINQRNVSFLFYPVTTFHWNGCCGWYRSARSSSGGNGVGFQQLCWMLTVPHSQASRPQNLCYPQKQSYLRSCLSLRSVCLQWLFSAGSNDIRTNPSLCNISVMFALLQNAQWDGLKYLLASVSIKIYGTTACLMPAQPRFFSPLWWTLTCGYLPQRLNICSPGRHFKDTHGLKKNKINSK